MAVAVPGRAQDGLIKYSFYAVYDRLLDSRTNSFTIWDFDFSGDGKTIIVAGNDNIYQDPVLYTLNSDGSNLRQILLPEEVSEIESITMDSAGTVAYFWCRPNIYKVEEDTVIPIFNLLEETGYNGVYNIVTNGHGNYVFFAASATYSQGWIHRINSDGTGLERVVYHEDVIRDGGYAGGLDGNYSVNHDGSKIAFRMSGYHDENSFHYKGELFLKDEEGYHQLTNDSEISQKGGVQISGDGNTIIFYSSGDENKWYSIKSDGTGRKPIADHGFNFVGMDVTYDGTVMVHGEGSANGGCLVATDGSANRELFSSTYPWNLRFNHLWSHIKMNDDGNRIVFLFDATEDGDRTFSLYTGYFNNPFAVSDAPLIDQINMVPPVIPDLPGKQLLLSTSISDPQGLEDLKHWALNELVDGRKESSGDVPVYFRWDPNDRGDWPDEKAGDGIFWSEGETRSIVDQFGEAGIRMGVVDNSWSVVIADTVFEIRTIPPPGKVELVSPSPGESEVDTALWFNWYAIGDALRYHFQLASDSLFESIIFEDDEIADTTLFISELVRSNTYFWRVRAENVVDYGEWSEIHSFSTIEADPTFLSPGHSLHPVISPNPVINQLYIDAKHAGNCRMEILSISGKKLYSDKLRNGTTHIDMSSFDSGVYTIIFRSGGDVAVKRIIKL
jgi:hypothetical protein